MVTLLAVMVWLFGLLILIFTPWNAGIGTFCILAMAAAAWHIGIVVGSNKIL